jgi:tetratricopeptide (TPR) repeat protein
VGARRTPLRSGIINLVDRLRAVARLVKIGLVGILIAVLGLAARPHAVEEAMQQARLAVENGNPEAAAARLGQVIEFYPWRTDLILLAGHYALQGGNHQEAIQYLERAAQQGGLAAEDLLALGDAYLALGDTAAALQAWERIPVEERLTTGYYERMAVYHREQGDYASTAADLKALLQVRPNDATLYYQLGLLMAVQAPEAALAYLSQAAEINPALAPQTQELISEINTARLFDEPAYSFLKVGQELASLGEWELAAEACKKALESRPDYAEAWAFLGEARQHLETSPQAGLEELEQALSLDGSSISANTFMGLYWQRQNDYEKALEYLQKAAEVDPQNPVLQVEIGNTLAEMGDMPTAQMYFEKATTLAPEDAMYWRLLAQFSLQHQIQVHELALPAARQAIILAPEDAKSLDVMGQTLLLLGDLLNAERFLLRAVQADANYPPARLHLGIVYLNLGKTEAGVDQLRLARTLAPDAGTAEQVERVWSYYFP